MELEKQMVNFLGIALIILIIGLIISLLAIIGYNTYIKYQDKHKKIEASVENTNFKNDRKD